jgi:hypothetical protein
MRIAGFQNEVRNMSSRLPALFLGYPAKTLSVSLNTWHIPHQLHSPWTDEHNIWRRVEMPNIPHIVTKYIPHHHTRILKYTQPTYLSQPLNAGLTALHGPVIPLMLQASLLRTFLIALNGTASKFKPDSIRGRIFNFNSRVSSGLNGETKFIHM